MKLSVTENGSRKKTKIKIQSNITHFIYIVLIFFQSLELSEMDHCFQNLLNRRLRTRKSLETS